MTNGNDLITPYAWMIGEDSKTPVINPNPNALTKREYFAAMAMQGFLSSETKATSDEFATSSVEVADALIKALNESNT